jgi:DNA-binding GntR family transcriptional regulator
LLEMIDQLQLANSRIVLSATRSGGWKPTSSHAHRQIVDALKVMDFPEALELLRRHIRGLERVTR